MKNLKTIVDNYNVFHVFYCSDFAICTSIYALNRFPLGGLAPLNTPPGICPGLAGPPDPSSQVVPTFHFIPSYAPVRYIYQPVTESPL
jgi:hypothetical protein